MSKDLWIIEYERIAETYANNGDRNAFNADMAALGFDRPEIEDHAEAVDIDCGRIEPARKDTSND